MPFLQLDTWSKAFFDGYDCPPGLMIPTKDGDAYRLNPTHNWVYNKLLIAEKQGLRCAPHGIAPDHYPVFSKPIYNLRSMGLGSGVLRSVDDYEQSMSAGFFWAEFLEGAHMSTDVAVVDGKPVWFCFAKGYPLAGGTFDHWAIRTGNDPTLRQYLHDFIETHLTGYTGMMNIETIGGTIIEIHLRFARQWTDLYGQAFIPALIGLYEHACWPADFAIPAPGYSVVLFAPPRHYRKPDQAFTDRILAMPGISSVQYPFTQGKAPSLHAMPPGGFRTAVINATDFEQAVIARTLIAEEIKRISR